MGTAIEGNPLGLRVLPVKLSKVKIRGVFSIDKDVDFFIIIIIIIQ